MRVITGLYHAVDAPSATDVNRIVSDARHQRDLVVILFVWNVMKKFLDNSTFLQWVGMVDKIVILFAQYWSQLLEYDHVKSFWILYTLQI